MQTLVLLHGALGTAQSLYPLKAMLEADFDVRTPEFSGHGSAAWPEDGFSMDRFGADLLDYLNREGLGGVPVFGYSMGGFIALRTAIAHPGRIRSIITLATKFAWTPETAAREAAGLDAEVLQAKAPKFVEALERAHPHHGGRRMLEATASLLGGMHAAVIGDEQFRSLEIPVQLLLGERDKMVTREETLHVRSLLQQGSFGIMPGTPHPLEAADPAVLAALIRSALLRTA